MNTRQQQPTSLVVSLIVVALLGLGLYGFTSGIIDKLNSINSDLGKAIVAGAVTLFAAIVSLVIGKIWEQKVKIKQEIREKKIPVYERQIESFFSMMFAEKCGDPKPTDQEMTKAIRQFTEKLIVWGGPEVIRAWSAFRLHDWQKTKAEEGFAKIELFMRAIREDLGNSNSGLAVGDLMKLFINDYGTEVSVPESEATRTA